MIDVIEINMICDELGTSPPKVVEYANCHAVIIRNGDGLKVLIVADEGMSRDALKHKIAAAFKVKAENLPSDGTMETFMGAEFSMPLNAKDAAALEAIVVEHQALAAKPDPVTPAKDIRAHQEAKKAK